MDRFCSYPGCRQIVRGRFCGDHQPSTRQRKARKTEVREHHCSRWQKLSKIYRAEHPICEWCAEQDISKPAQVVDHIVPARADMDLFYEESNFQALCHACHNTKTLKHEPMTIYSYLLAMQEEYLVICGKPGVGKTTLARQRGGVIWDWDRIYEAMTYAVWKEIDDPPSSHFKIMLEMRETFIKNAHHVAGEDRVTVIATNRWRAFDFARLLSCKVFYLVVPQEVLDERKKEAGPTSGTATLH